jgi:hypothetical protein
MTPSPNWRDRFIDLAAELCRARGEPAPQAQARDGHCLRLSLAIDGVVFDALHIDADDESAERILVQCRFGSLPATLHDEAPQLALQMNVGLNRSLAGVFGLDEEHDELIFCTQQNLNELRHEELLDGMSRIAALALQWRAHHFASTH